LVGRLRPTTGWTKNADPLDAHIFALALHMVRSTAEPIITAILDVVQKHQTSEDFPSRESRALVVELGGTNAAASGVAVPTYVNFPIDSAWISRNERDVRRRAADKSLTDRDIGSLAEEIRKMAQTLAPTVIHEFTHMALYRMYRNRSNPWLSLKKTKKLERLRQSGAPGQPAYAESKDSAELMKFSNADFRDSDLRGEIAELKDFEDLAPPEVKTVCERISGYSSNVQASELPSHVIEIMHLMGEPYVRQHLPKCYRVLVRIRDQVNTYIKAGDITGDK
jgi:hypothetical protein